MLENFYKRTLPSLLLFRIRSHHIRHSHLHGTLNFVYIGHVYRSFVNDAIISLRRVYNMLQFIFILEKLLYNKRPDSCMEV